MSIKIALAGPLGLDKFTNMNVLDKDSLGKENEAEPKVAKDKDKDTTYFEENATRILDRKNISKAQLAKEMGVAPQNINKLIGTKNVYTLSKISKFLLSTDLFIFNNSSSE